MYKDATISFMGTSHKTATGGDDSWTGLERECSEVLPLTAETFVKRLETMTAFNRQMHQLRTAMTAARVNADQST